MAFDFIGMDCDTIGLFRGLSPGLDFLPALMQACFLFSDEGVQWLKQRLD